MRRALSRGNFRVWMLWEKFRTPGSVNRQFKPDSFCQIDLLHAMQYRIVEVS